MGKVNDLGEKILVKLKVEGGVFYFGDKFDLEVIKKIFLISKVNYKKVIGGLFK